MPRSEPCRLQAPARVSIYPEIPKSPVGKTLRRLLVAGESMWAEKYRDSDRNGAGERYRHTGNGIFVDIEPTRSGEVRV